ncbi:hypothetical protein EDD85DRAFT_795051 [Armillaria nabsnona]|nr:hypothetical protein EDD85DRAFT_795051 [Armillaria nabsnona]
MTIRNAKVTVLRDMVIEGERWDWMEISDAGWNSTSDEEMRVNVSLLKNSTYYSIVLIDDDIQHTTPKDGVRSLFSTLQMTMERRLKEMTTTPKQKEHRKHSSDAWLLRSRTVHEMEKSSRKMLAFAIGHGVKTGRVHHGDIRWSQKEIQILAWFSLSFVGIWQSGIMPSLLIKEEEVGKV